MPELTPSPCAPPPSARLREYILVWLAALLLYGLTIAPGPLWQDSGLAQVRVLRRDLAGNLGLALSHPLYYILAFAFQDLPIASPALKTNLVSAVFAAVTVANIYWLVRLLTGTMIAALTAAFALMVAHTFWQHAVLAEVYSVSTALLSFEMLALCQFARQRRLFWLVLVFLANGFGISNHMLAVLHLPIEIAVLIYLTAQRQVGWRTWLFSAGAWLLGASLYLGLIFAAWSNGMSAIEVLRSALFGTAYGQKVLSLQLNAHLIRNSILYLGLNYPTPLALLAIPGLVALFRHPPRWFAVAFAFTLFIHLAWAIRYDVPDQYTFFIPSVVLIAPLIGLGVAWVMNRRWTNAAAPRRMGLICLVFAAVPIAVYAALPRFAGAAGFSLETRRELPFRDAYHYFLNPWKFGETGPQRFAETARDSLPDGAVLLADGTAVRPIHFLQLTGHWRDAIRVFPSPIGRDEDWPDPQTLTAELAAGRVYVVSPQRGYIPPWLLTGYDFEPAGVVFRVRPRPVP